ncbi:MAG TPA: hypothetical protein EYG04_02800 [Candidatus Poseidoniales archaeon]|nr:hypothetical protein [Candidatus Poseidoniales archaeon]
MKSFISLALVISLLFTMVNLNLREEAPKSEEAFDPAPFMHSPQSTANGIMISWQWDNQSNILQINSQSQSPFHNIEVYDEDPSNMIFEYLFVDQVNTAEWNMTISDGNCTCMISINSIEGHLHQIVANIGEEVHVPMIAMTSTPSTDPHRGSISYAGNSYNVNENISLSNTLIFCQFSAGHQSCESTISDYWNNVGGLVDSFSVNWTWEGDESFSINLNLQDVSQLSDGEYYVGWALRDENLLSSWSIIPNTLIVDRKAPEISLAGPVMVNESSQKITIDASQTDDQSSLFYSWIIYLPDGSARGPYEDEKQYLNDVVPSLLITPNISGEWVFKATITDEAGNQNVSNLTLFVANLGPVAHLALNSIPIQDGSSHQLVHGREWMFSANASTDTSNDADELTFSWLLDGVEISAQSEFHLEEHEISGVHMLNLRVTDDDGARDEISISLIIAGSEETVKEGKSIFVAVGISLLLVIIGTVSIGLFWARNSKRILPDWKPNSK